MALLSNCKIGFWTRIGTGEDLTEDSFDASRDVLIADAKTYLEQCGLSRSRADEVAKSTAARRAIGTIVGKDPDTGVILFARAWTRKKDGNLAIKVSNQIEDENGHGVYKDHSEYELTEDGRISQVNGPSEEYQRVKAAFEHTTTHYRGSDITKIIQAVLQQDGLGAYPCKKNGGVYFIPLRPEALDLLEKLEQFCILVGVRFSTYDIPDLSSRREEIAEAAARSLSQDLDAHNKSITSYGPETKLGIVENRGESLTATETMVKNLSGLLNGKALELLARIKELREMLAKKDAEIVAAQEKKKAERRGGRMIDFGDSAPKAATEAQPVPAAPPADTVPPSAPAAEPGNLFPQEA